MATKSKLGIVWDLTKAGAITIWWSAVALFLWALLEIGVSSRGLLFLSAFGAVARGPPQGPAPVEEIQPTGLEGEIPHVKVREGPMQFQPDEGAEEINFPPLKEEKFDRICCIPNFKGMKCSIANFQQNSGLNSKKKSSLTYRLMKSVGNIFMAFDLSDKLCMSM